MESAEQKRSSPGPETVPMVFVNPERCIGCRQCEFACAVEHSRSRDAVMAMFEDPVPRTRVHVEPGYALATSFPNRCRHCNPAPCQQVCPTQAIIFGDGGITAIGANCFNMAIVGSLAAWLVYRLISGRSAITSSRRVVGAALGGYIAIKSGTEGGATATSEDSSSDTCVLHASRGRPLMNMPHEPHTPMRHDDRQARVGAGPSLILRRASRAPPFRPRVSRSATEATRWTW